MCMSAIQYQQKSPYFNHNLVQSRMQIQISMQPSQVSQHWKGSHFFFEFSKGFLARVKTSCVLFGYCIPLFPSFILSFFDQEIDNKGEKNRSSIGIPVLFRSINGGER